MPVKIPKKIHAVWVGGVLGQAGRDNLASWKAINPNYEANLWIDSATFTEEDKTTGLVALKQWAKENNVVIRDISSKKNSKDKSIKGASDLYNKMKSRLFYDDELNGESRNLAAASDILRAEILYQQGGVYVDAEDVFPSTTPLGKLTADHGFLAHIERITINNDLMASAAKGEVITAYRNNIDANYHALYQNDKLLAAHRNPEFTSPELFAGANPRKMTTLRTSGPGALATTIENMPELSEEKITLPKDYYKLPPEQALSWFDPLASEKYETLIPVFRNYVREYFNYSIKNSVQHLEKIEQNQETKEVIHLLKEFEKTLNAFPTSVPMTEISKSAGLKFTPEQLLRLNQLDNFWDKFQSAANNTEDMLHIFIEKGISPKQIDEMLSKAKIIKTNKNHPVNRMFELDLAEIVSDLIKKKPGHDSEFLNKYDLVPKTKTIDNSESSKKSYSAEQKSVSNRYKDELIKMKNNDKDMDITVNNKLEI